MAKISPPRRGRPTRHPIDALRTRLWFQVVKLRSGLPSAYAIEQALYGGRAEGQIWRPRKFDAYRDGVKVPVVSADGSDAVSAAEAKFPGTGRWFLSPLWAVLRGEAFTYAHDVETALATLDASIVECLFTSRRTFGGEPKRALRGLAADDLGALVALGSFDALVAMVLLVQLSALVAAPELRRWALRGYYSLQPLIADAPETCLVYPELFTYIDRVCKHWIYRTPNERITVHFFWHAYARETWAGERMPFIEERLRALRVAEGRTEFVLPAD